MKVDNNIEVFVVANPHRRCLTADYVNEKNVVNYTIYHTPDYEVSKDWKPVSEYKYIHDANKKAANGHLRCQRGHQDCLKTIDKEKFQLMIEDDAVPNVKDWQKYINKSVNLLKKYEIVSLHGREIRLNEWDRFVNNGMIFLRPKRSIKKVWCLGSLCWFISPRAIEKFINMPYDGTPMDLLLANRFSFCVIKDSPFNHDRSEGSLIEDN